MRYFVFFCQAPADIIHILKEYEDLSSSCSSYNIYVEIVCVNSPKLLDFFSHISLNNVYVHYIKYFPILPYNLWKLFLWRRKAIKTMNRLGFLKKNKIFYFCSIYDDPITSFFINYLYAKEKEIVYLNHYDNNQNIQPIKKRTFKQVILENYYLLVTGIKYKFWNMSGRWNSLRFPIEKINVIEKQPILDKAIGNKYAYKVANSDGNAVLFFSQPNREHNVLSDEEYDSLNYKIASTLKKMGYKIYVKGHPRIGICESLKEFVYDEIPQIIPSEFIDLNAFKFCIGFATIALSSSAKIGVPSYSFLPMIKRHNTNYHELLKFINVSSNQKIKFVNSTHELSNL